METTTGVTTPSRSGTFYIVQLVPDLRPERVKFGWSSHFASRLCQYLTGAPTAAVFRTWTCDRSWEITAIGEITKNFGTPLRGESFDVPDLDELSLRAEAFFATHSVTEPRYEPLIVEEPQHVTSTASHPRPLRSLRRMKGLTQEQLAELAGVSEGTVRRIESGNGKWVRPRSMVRIANILDVAVSDVRQFRDEHAATRQSPTD